MMSRDDKVAVVEAFLTCLASKDLARLPIDRIGEPEDIARVVVFLASDAAGWISAQNIGINGGFA